MNVGKRIAELSKSLGVEVSTRRNNSHVVFSEGVFLACGNTAFICGWMGGLVSLKEAIHESN